MTINYRNHLYYGYTNYNKYATGSCSIFESTCEYIREMEKEKYIFTIDDIESILDVKKQYVQRKLIPNMDTLFITQPVKEFIKFCVHDRFVLDFYVHYVKTTFNHKGRLHKEFQLLGKALLISEASLVKQIKSKVLRVATSGDLNLFIPPTDKEVKLILEGNLYSVNTLREEFNLKHDTQIYRKISSMISCNRLKKFAIIDLKEMNKRYLIRYLKIQ